MRGSGRTLSSAVRLLYLPRAKIHQCLTESHPMTIELSKEDRQQAISSIERYFSENMEEKIGNVAASGLLGFFLEEVGPSIYNKGVADAQERIQARAMELDYEVHEEEFPYWQKHEKSHKSRR